MECQAKKSTADPPQDCGWPHCGCDPCAEKVIDSLLEEGWIPPHEVEDIVLAAEHALDMLVLGYESRGRLYGQRGGTRVTIHPTRCKEAIDRLTAALGLDPQVSRERHTTKATRE